MSPEYFTTIEGEQSMRFLTSGVALLPLLLVMPASPAADLAKIDRTIRKEPVYRTKAPKYGLLAFGPQVLWSRSQSLAESPSWPQA
jgi:hypothetical protein